MSTFEKESKPVQDIAETVVKLRAEARAARALHAARGMDVFASEARLREVSARRLESELRALADELIASARARELAPYTIDAMRCSDGTQNEAERDRKAFRIVATVAQVWVGYTQPTPGSGRAATLYGSTLELRAHLGNETTPASSDGKVSAGWQFQTLAGTVDVYQYWSNGPDEWSVSSTSPVAAAAVLDYMCNLHEGPFSGTGFPATSIIGN